MNPIAPPTLSRGNRPNDRKWSALAPRAALLGLVLLVIVVLCVWLLPTSSMGDTRTTSELVRVYLGQTPSAPSEQEAAASELRRRNDAPSWCSDVQIQLESESKRLEEFWRERHPRGGSDSEENHRKEREAYERTRELLGAWVQQLNVLRPTLRGNPKLLDPVGTWRLDRVRQAQALADAAERDLGPVDEELLRGLKKRASSMTCVYDLKADKSFTTKYSTSSDSFDEERGTWTLWEEKNHCIMLHVTKSAGSHVGSTYDKPVFLDGPYLVIITPENNVTWFLRRD